MEDKIKWSNWTTGKYTDQALECKDIISVINSGPEDIAYNVRWMMNMVRLHRNNDWKVSKFADCERNQQ